MQLSRAGIEKKVILVETIVYCVLILQCAKPVCQNLIFKTPCSFMDTFMHSIDTQFYLIHYNTD